jgi:hypothetical protein
MEQALLIFLAAVPSTHPHTRTVRPAGFPKRAPAELVLDGPLAPVGYVADMLKGWQMPRAKNDLGYGEPVFMGLDLGPEELRKSK